MSENVVFKSIELENKVLTLEVYGVEVRFDLQQEDVAKFWIAYLSEGQQKDEPLQLEIGQWYEDEEKELWQVKDKIEHICQHPDGTECGKVIQYEAQNNKGLKRHFRSDGKCVQWEGANLVRIAPPVESEKRSRTFAEELYEIAAEVHSTEIQIGYIKVAARRAARDGNFSLYLDIVNFPLSNQEKAYEMLRSDGFTIKDNYLRWGKE